MRGVDMNLARRFNAGIEPAKLPRRVATLERDSLSRRYARAVQAPLVFPALKRRAKLTLPLRAGNGKEFKLTASDKFLSYGQGKEV